MTAWEDRSPVRAAYLNPAFIAMVIAATSRGYAGARRQPMTWPLAFVTVPLVLHRPTRERLPRTPATHLPRWIADNPVIRAGFPARAMALVPAVREGLRVGLRHHVLTLEPDGVGASLTPKLDGDASTIVTKAGFVGRWLARTGDAATVFGLLGVEP